MNEEPMGPAAPADGSIKVPEQVGKPSPPPPKTVSLQQVYNSSQQSIVDKVRQMDRRFVSRKGKRS